MINHTKAMQYLTFQWETLQTAMDNQTWQWEIKQKQRTTKHVNENSSNNNGQPSFSIEKSYKSNGKLNISMRNLTKRSNGKPNFSMRNLAKAMDNQTFQWEIKQKLWTTKLFHWEILQTRWKTLPFNAKLYKKQWTTKLCNEKSNKSNGQPNMSTRTQT